MRLGWTVFLVLSVAAAQTPREEAALEKEAALGAQLASAARQRTRLIDDADLREYLEPIVQRLANGLPAAGFSYFFDIAADDRGGATHEPASFPGGYLQIPAHLVLGVESESELAGMLAHAMAHIAARQGRAAPRDDFANVPLEQITVSGSNGLGGGPDGSFPLGAVERQREREIEADALAVRAAAAAGYNPSGLANYIRRTQPEEAGPLSVLPPRGQRIAAMQATIAREGLRPSFLLDRAQLSAVQARARELLREAAPETRPRPSPTLWRP